MRERVPKAGAHMSARQKCAYSIVWPRLPSGKISPMQGCCTTHTLFRLSCSPHIDFAFIVAAGHLRSAVLQHLKKAQDSGHILGTQDTDPIWTESEAKEDKKGPTVFYAWPVVTWNWFLELYDLTVVLLNATNCSLQFFPMKHCCCSVHSKKRPIMLLLYVCHWYTKVLKCPFHGTINA